MKNTIIAALLTMFIVWDYEPGTKDSLEMAPTPAGPWNYYGELTLPAPVNGVYKVPVSPGFEKMFFRVKREIVFDIKPTSK